MQHKLVKAETTDGAEEYKCPTCGKHVQVEGGRAETLVRGDDTVAHPMSFDHPGLSSNIQTRGPANIH